MDKRYDAINPESSDQTGDAEETAVCPGCFSELPPLADFCPACNRPITALATMDPLKHIYAQGWAYRQAAHAAAPSALILIGMWLVLGPSWLMISIALWFFLDNRSQILHSVENTGAFILVCILWMAHAGVLHRITARYVRLSRIPPGHCVACGHDLAAVTGEQCPGCGMQFDPEEVEAAIEAAPDNRTSPGRVLLEDLVFLLLTPVLWAFYLGYTARFEPIRVEAMHMVSEYGPPLFRPPAGPPPLEPNHPALLIPAAVNLGVVAYGLIVLVRTNGRHGRTVFFPIGWGAAVLLLIMAAILRFEL